MPVIAPLFSQFRQQYADGCLTTELVGEGDTYAVRATLTVGERAIATALAADSSLEAADDRAKQRVLAMVGIGGEASSVEPLPEPAAPPDSESPPPEPPLPEPPLPEQSEPAEVAPLEDSEDLGRPLDAIAPDEAPAPADVPASAIAAAAMESFDDSSPVDLSDIIAQTDVEMSRLGWSSVQGRTHLEQTFSKRSRQQLTDEELLAFLLYLESQPTPSMG